MLKSCGSISALASVYYGRDGALIVILLGGGRKRTQARDIVVAQQRWREYLDDKAED